MNPSQRHLDLACDRALSGLDPAEEAELAASLPPGAEIDPSLALAAAAIALSELTMDEPLPAHLAERVLAAATSNAPVRTVGRGGTIPMAGRANVSPLLTMQAANDAPRSPSQLGPANVVALVPRTKSPNVTPARPSRLAWIGWVAAAACLAIAVGSFLRARQAITEVPAVATVSPTEARARLLAEARDVVRIPWSPTEDPAGRGASGEVVWSSARQEGYMTFRSLGPNDPKRAQYQLWIFDAERDERYPVDGGVFDVGSGDGEVVVPITARVAVAAPKLFAVTVEKPGGVVVSKRERIVVAAPVKS